MPKQCISGFAVRKARKRCRHPTLLLEQRSKIPLSQPRVMTMSTLEGNWSGGGGRAETVFVLEIGEYSVAIDGECYSITQIERVGFLQSDV